MSDGIRMTEEDETPRLWPKPEMRMERAVGVSELLLLFLAGAHLSHDPELVFGLAGGHTEFLLASDSVADSYVLYRLSESGDLLLVNCSQPEGPQPDGYRFECLGSYHFVLNNLTVSQSGDCGAEGRGEEGNIVVYKRFRLTVCAEGHGAPLEEIVTYDDSVALCRPDSPLGHGSSLRLYQLNWPDSFLVLDTSSSLEPLLEGLRGRLQVNPNTSLVTLSGITHPDVDFFCTIWRGAQCQHFSHRSLNAIPKRLFAHEKQNLTLPCISKGESPDQMHWLAPTGIVWLSNNQTRQQEVMYMLDGSQTGDYSLVISSVSHQHTGSYRCEGRDNIKENWLFVCTKLPPVDVMFSHGESVRLVPAPLNDSWILDGLQWYRQKDLQPQVLIVDLKTIPDHLSYLHADFFNKSVLLPEDMRGRVTVSELLTSRCLAISNLKAEDSGRYTWRVSGEAKGRMVCSEGTIHLLHSDRVDTPLYSVCAVLIGCVLLAAVLWFSLRRRRRREQTSGRQRGEGRRSEEGALCEDVDLAEHVI